MLDKVFTLVMPDPDLTKQWSSLYVTFCKVSLPTEQLKTCIYLTFTVRLLARDFYEVIVHRNCLIWVIEITSPHRKIAWTELWFVSSCWVQALINFFYTPSFLKSQSRKCLCFSLFRNLVIYFI